MIVDFQHHFTPRELIKADPGDRLILHYDENGAPSYTVHSLLYDLDEHIRMMDLAGIDAAWLTSAAGLRPCASSTAASTSSASRALPSRRKQRGCFWMRPNSSRSGAKQKGSACSCSCIRR